MGLSISVFGMGYVGSVSAACFAHAGHKVIGVDVNPLKVEMMASGRTPIVEARMSELIEEGHRVGLLHATPNAEEAVCSSDISFVCVGTPSMRSGKLDLSYVERVVHEIGLALKQKKSHHIVVLRSTVLPGTTESLVIPTLEKASGRSAGAHFDVCYNPEFMREGSAVSDFFQPPYTVLGAHDARTLAPLRELYKNVSGPVFETQIPVAEMVKYVCNAFHAVKIGFANEVGTLCKSLAVDTEAVTKIYTSDTKLNISPAYLAPGFAFGGSCLPKDLRALSHRAKELDVSLPLLDSIIPSNLEHIDRAVETVLRTNKRRIAFLGLSFKPGTDDLRESPQVQMIKRLLGEGCQVKVWDRDVLLGRLAGSNRQYIEEVIPHIGSLLSADLEEVVRSGEVVIIATKVGKDQLSACLRDDQILVDLVNLTSGSRPEANGAYHGICW
ncbi:MAG TPA: nucleotide sugar dehydrogenase [Verrucomicrobiae bacterium]|nr:nucleotide sugar dehydrogenase [Verrucomicrobiae bacterium]